jgi:hypothetical protein
VTPEHPTPKAYKARLTEDNTLYARTAGQNVAIRRNHHGLTQRQLAEAMSQAGYPMTESIIFFTEKGSSGARSEPRPRNMSVDHLMAFAAFFGCQPMDLLAPACPNCEGVPPVGFTCNACGSSRAPVDDRA